MSDQRRSTGSRRRRRRGRSGAARPGTAPSGGARSAPAAGSAATAGRKAGPGSPGGTRPAASGPGQRHRSGAVPGADALDGRAATAVGAEAGVGGVAVTQAEIAANRRRAVLLAAAAGSVPGLLAGVILGAVAGVLAGVVAAVVVAVAVAVVVPWRATRFVLGLVGGRAVGEGEQPRLANLVAGLCATFGVPPPRLWVVADPVPNACALGRRPAGAVLVVTTGLLDRLGLIEMEGVVAHELAHVKRHDTAVSETAVAVLSPLVRLTGADGLVHAVIGRGREYRADEVAAATVRYPPGLHDALALMEEGPEPSKESVFRGPRWTVTRWLWVDTMVGDRRRDTVGEIDATSVRRAALAEW